MGLGWRWRWGWGWAGVGVGVGVGLGLGLGLGWVRVLGLGLTPTSTHLIPLPTAVPAQNPVPQPPAPPTMAARKRKLRRFLDAGQRPATKKAVRECTARRTVLPGRESSKTGQKKAELAHSFVSLKYYIFPNVGAPTRRSRLDAVLIFAKIPVGTGGAFFSVFLKTH